MEYNKGLSKENYQDFESLRQNKGIIDLSFGKTITEDRSFGYTHAYVVRFTSKRAYDKYNKSDITKNIKRKFVDLYARPNNMNTKHPIIAMDFYSKRVPGPAAK